MALRDESVRPYVRYGYVSGYTQYPQLFALVKAFGPDTKLYTTVKPLHKRGDAATGHRSEIVLHQLQSLNALPTKRARKIAVSWRRSHQNVLSYLTGYARLMLSDLRNGRPRRDVMAILFKTISEAPFLKSKLILLLNSIALLVPVRLAYLLVKGKRMDIRNYREHVQTSRTEQTDFL